MPTLWEFLCIQDACLSKDRNLSSLWHSVPLNPLCFLKLRSFVDSSSILDNRPKCRKNSTVAWTKFSTKLMLQGVCSVNPPFIHTKLRDLCDHTCMTSAVGWKEATQKRWNRYCDELRDLESVCERGRGEINPEICALSHIQNVISW